MRKLIYQLANSICLALEAPKPQVKLLKVSYYRILDEVTKLQLIKMYPALLDHFQDYYYVTTEEWGKIFNWIYFEFDMPSFVSARMDCDGFSVLLKGLVEAHFGLNSFGIVIGTTSAGGHAWNLFRTEDGWMQFEPQTGEVFELGTKQYVPQYILV